MSISTWVRDCAEANGQPALRTRARAHHELLDHAKGPLLRPFRAFDARVAHLLTVANGTIDLRTGELLHDPAHLITRASPVSYDPHAVGGFPARLLGIFQGDGVLADWFRREIGMAATGFDQAARLTSDCDFWSRSTMTRLIYSMPVDCSRHAAEISATSSAVRWMSGNNADSIPPASSDVASVCLES